MADIGYASLGIIPSFEGFESALRKGVGPTMTTTGRRSGEQMAGGMRTAIAGRARSIFAPLMAAGAAYKAGQFLASSVTEASNLNESLNAVRVSYGKNAKAVQELGRQAAESIGLSNTEFNSLSVRFSAFSKTIAGGEGRAVVKTLDDLTTRASDFASVMNLEVNEAAEIFQSGLAGETEPLRKFGIDLSAAKVEAFAYAEGIAKAGDKLTESEKVQARYGLLMKQTAQTQGDFANTSDELANQQRILNARWDDAKAKFGTALLPIIKDGVSFLNREGIPAFERFADWFNNKGAPAISEFAEDMRPVAKEILPAAADALGKLAGFARDAAPYVKDVAQAFNDMPDWAKTLIVGGGAGLYGLNKLRGLGGLGSKGGLGKGGPLGGGGVVPVFVTNKGFGDGPGGAPGSKGGKTPLLAGGAALTLGALTGKDTLEATDNLIRLSKAGEAVAESQESIRKALEESRLGKYASDLGIDLDRLSRSLYLYGEDGKYVAEVQKQLHDSGKGFGNMAEGLAGTIIPGLTFEAQKAAKAGSDLHTIVDKVGSGFMDTSGAAQRLTNEVFGSAVQFGKTGASAQEYRRKLESLPKQVQTLIQTPGALGSRQSVQELRRQFDLTPKQVQTVMSLVGMDNAIIRAQRLRQDLLALDNKTVNTYVTTTYQTRGRPMGVAGHATGGFISGPGSATSDSIPAYLSNGEYVIKAAAVAKYGVAMFDKLNTMKFAQGGHVRKYATGGKVDKLEPLTNRDFRDFNLKADMGVREIRAMFKAFQQAFKAAGGEWTKQLEKMAARAVNLTKKYDDHAKALEKATSRRDSLIQARDSYRSSVRSSFDNDIFGNGVAGLSLQLNADRNDANAMRKALNAAKAKGLSGGLFKALAASGDLNTAQQLAGMSRAQIREYEQLYSSTNKARGNLADMAGREVYGEQIKEQNKLIRQQNRVIERLNNKLDRIEGAVERGARKGVGDKDRETNQRRRARG